MPSTASTILFETGLGLRRSIPVDNRRRHIDNWHVIGRLEDATPFLVHYANALTHWDCALELGAPLRRKILHRLRQEVVDASVPPAYVTVHDLRETDEADLRAGGEVAGELVGTFLKQVWRAQYLHDRDEDYVMLCVPFAEKDAAKALGATWCAEHKTWRVKQPADLSAFARWLPQAAPGPGPR